MKSLSHQKLVFSALCIALYIVYTLPTTADIMRGIFFKSFNKNSFSIVRNTKKYTPHSTKLYDAPCHNPVNDQTTAILNICLFNPFLLPPSGMYT